MPTPSNVILGVGRPNLRTRPPVVVTSAAILSSTDKNSGITISNVGRLATCSGTTAARSGRGDTTTTAITTGNKFYMEWRFYGTDANSGPGFTNATATFTDGKYPGDDTNGFTWFQNGTRGYNGSFPAGPPTWARGDRLGIAIDFTAGLWYPKVNGVFQGNPEAGTGGQTIPAITGTLYPAYVLGVQFDFTTFNPDATPPSGFNRFP